MTSGFRDDSGVVLWTQFCLGVHGCVESVVVITELERRVRADHQIGQNSGRDRQCPDAWWASGAETKEAPPRGGDTGRLPTWPMGFPGRE